MKPNHKEIETFANAYIYAAQWSSADDERDDFTDLELSPCAEQSMRSEALAFLTANYGTLREALSASPGLTWDSLGHDFWLTRCGHGAGYWDRGLGSIGDTLTASAEQAGERWLYIGDDGLLYHG